MAYTVKITKILPWVEDHYSVTEYRYVKDSEDTYIEIENLDEAILLESMNRTRKDLLIIEQMWIDKYGQLNV